MNDALQYGSPTERVNAWTDGGVLHLRFNNPARHNALSIEMWEAVPQLLARAGNDPAVRLVVFSGQGEKAFASGDDVSQFEDARAAFAAAAGLAGNRRERDLILRRAAEAAAVAPKPA